MAAKAGEALSSVVEHGINARTILKMFPKKNNDDKKFIDNSADSTCDRCSFTCISTLHNNKILNAWFVLST